MLPALQGRGKFNFHAPLGCEQQSGSTEPTDCAGVFGCPANGFGAKTKSLTVGSGCDWYTVVKTLVAAISLVILSISAAGADEPDVTELREIGEKAVPLRDAWERCAAGFVKRELETDLSAEAVADRVIRRCQREEFRLRSALRRSVGPEQSNTVMNQLRSLYRSNLTGIVEQLRKR
jgi:hypothetical protein